MRDDTVSRRCVGAVRRHGRSGLDAGTRAAPSVAARPARMPATGPSPMAVERLTEASHAHHPFVPSADRDRSRRWRRARVRARPSSARSAAPSRHPAGSRDAGTADGVAGQPPANGAPEPTSGSNGGEVAAVDDAKIIRTGTMSLAGQRPGTGAHGGPRRDRRRSAATSAPRPPATMATSRRPRSPIASRPTSGRRRSICCTVSAG